MSPSWQLLEKIHPDPSWTEMPAPFDGKLYLMANKDHIFSARWSTAWATSSSKTQFLGQWQFHSTIRGLPTHPIFWRPFPDFTEPYGFSTALNDPEMVKIRAGLLTIPEFIQQMCGHSQKRFIIRIGSNPAVWTEATYDTKDEGWIWPSNPAKSPLIGANQVFGGFLIDDVPSLLGEGHIHGDTGGVWL